MTNIGEYIRTNRPTGDKADGSLFYTCPMCGGFKKLELDASGRMWFCHKCQKGGSLTGVAGREVDEDHEGFIPESILSPACNGSIYWRYLQSRGLPDDRIRMLRPHEGPLCDRVYFPVYPMYSDRICWYTGRAIFDGMEPPYMNPSLKMCRTRKTEVLWGLHRLTAYSPSIVLCEGIFDAVWWKGGLAMLGKTLSPFQAGIIMDLNPAEVCVALDGDAWNYLLPASIRLSEAGFRKPVYAYRFPPNMDPDDLGRKGGSLTDVRKERLQ